MRTRPVRLVVTIAFVVGCVLVGAWIVARDWDRISAAGRHLTSTQIGSSFGFGLVAMALMLVSWVHAVRACGIDISLRQGWSIYPVAQVTKYVPGSVWPILAQATLGRTIGAPATAMSSAGAVHLALSVGVTLAMGTVVSPFFLTIEGWIAWAPVVALVLLLALWPPVLNRLLSLATHALARARLPVRLPTVESRHLARSAVWCASANVFFALHIWSLLPAFGRVSIVQLTLSLAAYALASSAGVLVVFAPAGAGAREGVMTLVLCALYPLATALVVAVVSRVVLVAVDVLLALTQAPTLKAPWQRRPGPARGPESGRQS